MFRPGPPQDLLELPERFELGDVTVELAAARASRAGKPLALEPKAFDLMLLLAANPGRLIEKEEIFERLWPGVVVGDNALTRVVAQLRRALGDDAETPRYIETVRTRGYRALADARALPPALATSAPKANRPFARRGGRIAAAAAAGGAGMLLLVLASLARRGEEPISTALRAGTAVQLTSDAAFDGQPTLAPNGSRVVFVTDRRGATELWSRALPGGEERPLAGAPRGAVDPAYSADGATLAFATVGGGIWTMPSDGGEPRRVTDFGSRPAFSPDGSRLVFQSQEPTVIHSHGWPASRESTLWVVELATGALREITRRGDAPGGHGAPAWSPDGRTIAFGVGSFRSSGLWRVAADGAGRPEPILELHGTLTDPIFDRDGRHLFAIVATPEAGPMIARLPLDGARRETLEPLLPAVPAGSGRLSLTRDGSTLVYAAVAEKGSVERVALDAGGEVVPPSRPLMPTEAARLSSPIHVGGDGVWVAVVRLRTGAPGDLVFVDTASGETRELREAVRGRLLPLAGEEVAIVPFDRTWALGVAARDGRTRPLPELTALLATPPGVDVIRWHFARDLSCAVFTVSEADATRLVLRRAGAPWPAQPLVAGDADDWGVLAPDCRRVAFQRVVGPRAELWAVEADGTRPRRLAAAGQNWSGGFSPDGSRIAFVALRDGAWNLWSVGEDGTGERRLTDNRQFSAFYRYASWSPRGDEIAVERTGSTAEVWSLRLARRPRP